MSDGGEGFLQAFTGKRQFVVVSGPLGRPVRASFLLAEHRGAVVGIIESAEAIGRHLVVAPTSDDALRATSRPLGEVMVAARDAGATELLIGLGGSATSDGGLGVFHVLEQRGGLRVPVTLALDVEVSYVNAVDFATQKGVAAHHLDRVRNKLRDAASSLFAATGVDPTTLVGGGAAGGVAGALLALGATGSSGAQLVAERSGCIGELARAAVLITGEGALDATSLKGKVVGWMIDNAPQDCQVIVLAGTADDATIAEVQRSRPGTIVCALDRVVGREAARTDPLQGAIAALSTVDFRGPNV